MSSQFPPVVKNDFASKVPKGVFGRAQDPTKLVVPKGRYLQPSLEIPGGHKFVWPGGTEGIRIEGQATLAEHKYLGDNRLIVEVMHRDARRLTLSGLFSGETAAYNVRQLLDVITSGQPRGGKLLTIPGVLVKQQRVAVESYNFEHAEGEKDDSFTYSIVLVDFGTAAKLPRINEIILRASINPVSTTVPDRGTSQRTFTTNSGARTLRAIAKVVYNNPNRWDDVYHKNLKLFNGFSISIHNLPTYVLPTGLKVKY